MLIEDSDIFSKFLESTYDIDSDVNLIYDKGGFKQFFEFLSKKEFTLKNINTFTFTQLSTKQLKEEDSRRANKILPVNIICSFNMRGSFYHVEKNSSNNYISLSPIYKDIISYIERNYDLTNFSKKEKKNIQSSISGKGMKIIIAHELSHWISDCLNNKHLSKIVQHALELDDTELLKLNQKNVNMTYFELDAQIHGIKNLKRTLGSSWNKLTFYDMILKYPNLFLIIERVYHTYGKSISDLWQKNILRRMHREGLIGKQMNNFIEERYLNNIFNI